MRGRILQVDLSSILMARHIYRQMVKIFSASNRQNEDQVMYREIMNSPFTNAQYLLLYDHITLVCATTLFT